MAQSCANCGSGNTQAAADRVNCLDCGRMTDYNGDAAPSGGGQAVRDAVGATMADPAPQIAGNIADLNRLGVTALSGATPSAAVAEAVRTPPGMSGVEAKETAKAQLEDIDAASEAIGQSTAAEVKADKTPAKVDEK